MRLCSCMRMEELCMGNREKFESWLGVTDWLNLLTLARGRDHQPQENERMHFWEGPIGALFMVRQLWLMCRNQGRKWLEAGHFRAHTVRDGHGKPDHNSRVLGHRTVTIRAVWQAGLKFWLVIKTSFIISSSGTASNHVCHYPTLSSATERRHLAYSRHNHYAESGPHRPQCLDQAASEDRKSVV